MILTTDLLICLVWVSDSQGIYLCFNKDDTLADSLVMNTYHYVWLMVQYLFVRQ